MTKKCTKCRTIKPLESFYKNRTHRDGFHTVCKSCHKEAGQIYNQSHRKILVEKTLDWKNRNKERWLANKRKYHHLHKGVLNENRRQRWHTPAGVFNSIIGRLKRGTQKGGRNGEMLFSQAQFVDWYTSLPRNCFYCEIPETIMLTLPQFNRKIALKLTVDRIDPKGHYAPDNVCLACYLCNQIKGDIFTAAEMKHIATQYIKPRWQMAYDIRAMFSVPPPNLLKTLL